MKLFALATPLLALGLVLLLQRMEAWCADVPRAAGRTHRHPDRRIPSTPTRSTMRNLTGPSSAATVDEAVAEPLLRDPPAPPGYVDPLSGNPRLVDLVAVVEVSGRAGRCSDAPRIHTG